MSRPIPLPIRADAAIPSIFPSAPGAGAAFLLALSALMLLFGYDADPLAAWDESRNANNAIEMVTSGNWLVLHYGGLPDHWNTKPPLLIWLIAGLMKAGAPPLLALRLPS